MKTEKKLFQWAAVLLCWVGFSQCQNPPAWPQGANCTYTIAAPAFFNDCNTKHLGNVKIKVAVNLITKFYDANNNGSIAKFDEKDIVVDPAVTPFPITITALAPNNGKPYTVGITMQGEVCSECANGRSDPSETPYGACGPSATNTTTNPWTQLAAIPRWNGNGSFSSYHATESIGVLGPIPNVHNSCAYCVSW